MKIQISNSSHGDYQRYLYEAPVKSMPVLSSRSPYRVRGDAYYVHCGVWVWESGLQMKHGTLRHKKCGYRVRVKPIPCVQAHNTLERLKREKPKRHYHV